MKKETHRAKTENVRFNHLDEWVERGRRLHDRAVGDFFIHWMSRAIVSLKCMSVRTGDATTCHGAALKRSHPAAV